ncbi:MAG: VanZ family protein [Bacteroidetes bacterium]|nr:VanZ family protein [Bacteroidota bacterium]
MRTLLYKHVLLFSILWAGVIFMLCATPGQYIPTANWLELLSFDKFVHASVFFVLTALWLLVALKYRQSKTTAWLYFLLCVVYGGALEMMQATVFSNRSADWQDMVANTLGCVVALWLFKKIKTLFVAVN